MAKLIMFVSMLLVAVAAIWAAPAEDFSALKMLPEVEAFEGQEVDDHLRFRRVTCDLLSVKGVVNDAACAANCLSMGKAGGRCNGGVCQCRKTNFKDLWDRRFG